MVFDIAIVGIGPVGACLAGLLASVETIPKRGGSAVVGGKESVGLEILQS